MTITIKVEGRIKAELDPIEIEISTPANWKPIQKEFDKVLEILRFSISRLEQRFAPAAANN